MRSNRLFSGTVPRRVARIVPLLTALTAAAWAGSAEAQFGRGMGFGGVGGISVDAEGIIRNLDGKALDSLAAERRQLLQATKPVPAGAQRKVSLAGIVAAAREAGPQKPLPPEVLFLGGLTRITHVLVDPERHDIVLVGPAEKPVIAPSGAVVGAESGRPLLQLEDLLVALRSIGGARNGGVQCSIDPTRDGLTRLDAFLGKQRQMSPDREALFREMERALGPQTVSVRGVPADSRFAQVLVAADYRMKRIGMGLEPSGVRQLPSYLVMVPTGGQAAALPRFWLEAEYDPIARDPDELAWRLSGRRMKCLTESDVAGRNGIERGKAPVDKAAQRWCDALTAHYEEVSAKHPVFAELLNCVDLAVVAALIDGRQLDQRAGLDLKPLLDPAALPASSYEVPATVPTVATGLKKGNVWVISASGGVQFQPWEFAAQANAADDVAGQRTVALAARPATGWWWD